MSNRAKLRRLAGRVSRTSYAEGVEEAGEGDGANLDRKRRASHLALKALLDAIDDAAS